MRYLLVLTAICFCGFVAAMPLEIVSYGDLTSRDNNLAGITYQSDTGFVSDTRLLYGEHDRDIRPYLRLNVAASDEEVAEENIATYGAGLEWRPLKNVQLFQQQPLLSWLPRTRVYAEYLHQSTLRGDRPEWNPTDDLIIGFDAWRPYGTVNAEDDDYTGKNWAEFFIGAAYHTTDFYLDDYNSIRSGMNLKVGRQYGSDDLPIMPYIAVDLNTTSEHDFFWQNRVIGSVGLRSDHRFHHNEAKLKYFAEQRYILGYLKGTPADTDEVPWSDFVIGIAYEVNRY